MKQKKVTEANI